MIEYISIGQIIGAFGIKGEVKVYPLTDNIYRYDTLEYIYIENNKQLLKYNVLAIKYVKNLVILKIEGIDDVESVMKFQNKYIKVHRKNAVKLADDSYFVCDMIGSTVHTIEDIYLGKVKDIIQTASNDVFIVKNEDNEILIPGLKSIFKEINIYKGKIIVDLPEGLI